MTETTTNPKLLELAPAEIAIPLQVAHGGRRYRVRHLLRPPMPADWFAYEAALAMAVEELPPANGSDEPGYRLQVRASDAALTLWERLAARVEGYDLPASAGPGLLGLSEVEGSPAENNRRAAPTLEGSQGNPVGLPAAGRVSLPANTDSDWRALVPLSHKEAAVNALTLVAPAASVATGEDTVAEGFPLRADERVVVLEAVRGGVAYPRLVHRFRPPTLDAERAYRRLLAETLIVRGTRTPRTLLPARLPGLVKLYDQLIVGVEGYVVNGQPPASGLQIAQTMDAWHKRAAVQALFGELSASAPEAASPEAPPTEEAWQ